MRVQQERGNTLESTIVMNRVVPSGKFCLSQRDAGRIGEHPTRVQVKIRSKQEKYQENTNDTGDKDMRKLSHTYMTDGKPHGLPGARSPSHGKVKKNSKKGTAVLIPRKPEKTYRINEATRSAARGIREPGPFRRGHKGPRTNNKGETKNPPLEGA